MCRYATKNYKQTYTCFQCHKAFKKTNFTDYLKQHHLLDLYRGLAFNKTAREKELLETKSGTTAKAIETDYQKKIAVCPDCGGQLANLGMDTKTPRKNQTKEWVILEGMYHMGISFQSCGCDGIGFVPKNTSDYKNYLTSHLTYYTGRKDDTKNDSSLNTFQRQEQARYWQEKIKKVKTQLEKSFKRCQ